MKRDYLKIILYCLLGVALVAWFAGAYCDYLIINEQTLSRTEDKTHRLSVKGHTYYVTDTQLFYHQASISAFVGSLLVSMSLGIWIRRRDKLSN